MNKTLTLTADQAAAFTDKGKLTVMVEMDQPPEGYVVWSYTTNNVVFIASTCVKLRPEKEDRLLVALPYPLDAKVEVRGPERFSYLCNGDPVWDERIGVLATATVTESRVEKEYCPDCFEQGYQWVNVVTIEVK